MFTGKIPKEMPQRLLSVIYNMYLEKHGPGIRNLNYFTVALTAHELFAMRVPDLYEEKGNVAKPLLVENFEELEARGYLRKGEPLRYHLTEKGYDHASKGRWQNFVDYWNSNPGLNTLVAIIGAGIASLSLVVAVIALVNSASPAKQAVPTVLYKTAAQLHMQERELITNQ
jgi:hypothetical protein